MCEIVLRECIRCTCKTQQQHNNNKQQLIRALFLDFIQIQKTLLNNILIGKKTSE